MKLPIGLFRGEGSTTALALVLALQAMAAVFFVADVAADLSFAGFDAHVIFEAVVSIALIAGVIFGGVEMRRVLERARRTEAALTVARGALAEVIDTKFRTWGLTAAEREVALFALKGFDVAGIADLRGAAPGTVRAQLARVYAKGGVSSRAELLSVFIEDLLGDPLPPTSRDAADTGATQPRTVESGPCA